MKTAKLRKNQKLYFAHVTSAILLGRQMPEAIPVYFVRMNGVLAVVRRCSDKFEHHVMLADIFPTQQYANRRLAKIVKSYN